MSDKNRQIVNVTALMAGLAALPDEAYDQEIFGRECGTVHCALGWAAAWKIGGLWLKKNWPVYGTEPYLKYDCSAASIVFGKDSYNRIFTTCGHGGWKRADALRALGEHLISLAAVSNPTLNAT